MYERLRTTNLDLLADFKATVEEAVPPTPRTQQRLSVAVAKKYDDLLSRQWTVKVMNYRTNVREQFQHIIKVVETLKGFVSVMIQIDPIHVGLPWPGTKTLLIVGPPFH